MTSKGLTLTLTTDRKLISREAGSQRILGVSIMAPTAADSKTRIPLNLAIVLDRSGSMSGNKLEEAKQAALHILDRLEAQDRAAVVAFDDKVKVLVPCTTITDASRNQMKEAIYHLCTGGSTALHDGWLTGCREIAQFLQERTLNRCLLLTDGLANVGITDPEQIAVEARDLYDREISTSTFGVGGGFDEHLLEAVANAGGGNFYYIESPATIARIFDQEFSGLAEVTARDVEVTMDLGTAVINQVLGGWRSDCPAPGQVRLSLGSLGSSLTRTIYLKLNFPPTPDGATEVSLKASARGKGKQEQILESKAEIHWQYAAREKTLEEEADVTFMKDYAAVLLAEDANVALKLERSGKPREAGDLLKTTLKNTRNYLDGERTNYFQDMANRMAHGMDETERKRSHHMAYLHKQGRFLSEVFQLERPSGHILINCDGVNVLIDSGSPVSIGDIPGWTFMQQPVSLMADFGGVTPEYLSRQVGARVDVLLGMDVLKKWYMALVPSSGLVYFGRESMSIRSMAESPLEEYLMGVPVVNMEVKGRRMRLALDTGARTSFLPAEFLKGRSPAGTGHDFYPGYGEFDTPLYRVQARLAGEVYLAECGILPPMLELALKATQVDGILGMDLLDHFQIQLAFPEKRLFLDRSAPGR